MYFLLCTGEAVLADRIPEDFFKIVGKVYHCTWAY